MAVPFTVVALILIADFVVVWLRARREWHDTGNLSPKSGSLITTLYALIVILLVLAVVWRPLELDLSFAVAAILGGLLVVAGVALAAPGFVPFESVQQLYGVERGRLITSGIYRYSRNSQYAGLGIALLGAAVVARSGLALLVVAAYWLAVRAWLVIEEEHLHAAFGAEYDAYRDRAPRFLGPRGGN